MLEETAQLKFSYVVLRENGELNNVLVSVKVTGTH
jgi:hypothetical protein